MCILRGERLVSNSRREGPVGRPVGRRHLSSSPPMPTVQRRPVRKKTPRRTTEPAEPPPPPLEPKTEPPKLFEESRLRPLPARCSIGRIRNGAHRRRLRTARLRKSLQRAGGGARSRDSPARALFARGADRRSARQGRRRRGTRRRRREARRIRASHLPLRARRRGAARRAPLPSSASLNGRVDCVPRRAAAMAPRCPTATLTLLRLPDGGGGRAACGDGRPGSGDGNGREPNRAAARGGRGGASAVAAAAATAAAARLPSRQQRRRSGADGRCGRRGGCNSGSSGGRPRARMPRQLQLQQRRRRRRKRRMQLAASKQRVRCCGGANGECSRLRTHADGI